MTSAVGTGVDKVLITLTAVGWVVYTGNVRGSILSEIEKEYVQAANVAGLPIHKIIR